MSENQEYISYNGGTDDAAWIEDVDLVTESSSKKEKVEYVCMVLQCEEFAVNAFVAKHSKVLNSEYWYSANLIARILNQIEF